MSEQPLSIANMRLFYSPTLRSLLVTCLLLGLTLLRLLSEAQAAADQNGPQKEPSTPNKSAPPSAQPAPPPKQAAPSKKPEKTPIKKLSGAELYALHCNRCHPERYAPERTAEQWKTILLHMRTRANLPAEQARAILQYLQEDSGK
jgi:hypothetical protein